MSVQPDPPFGFLVCDKPTGMTSRDIVNIVANRFWATRVVKSGDSTGKHAKLKFGHAGTLDPLAQGVLVVGVGRAVRLVSHVQNQPKHYTSTFLLGQETASGDLEDTPTLRQDLPIPSENELHRAAQALTGTIQQRPPAHSAIKINGRRAYDLVRAGENVIVPTRQVQIHSLEITRYEFPEVDLNIVCGSGTYVRTLGMDLAAAVGTVGVMKYLRRTSVGKFDQQNAVSIDAIGQGDPRTMLLPALWAVCDLPHFEINDEQATRLMHGLDLSVQRVEVDPVQVAKIQSVAVWRGEVFAILQFREGRLWPSRVFPRADVPKIRVQSLPPS